MIEIILMMLTWFVVGIVVSIIIGVFSFVVWAVFRIIGNLSRELTEIENIFD